MQNELIGDQLNLLEIVSTIAAGGMGVVYRHQHGVGDFRKVVALKLIREEYSAIDEFKDNFMGEAKLVADLIHTNIVQTYHLGNVWAMLHDHGVHQWYQPRGIYRSTH